MFNLPLVRINTLKIVASVDGLRPINYSRFNYVADRVLVT